MLAYSYLDQNKFGFTKKPVPQIVGTRDAIVKVMLASVCTSDLHIKGGHVPRAVRGVTVGHEMVGVVEKVGKDVRNVKAGDRVCVNVETFCGECFFCRRGFVNTCTDPLGGWALGCRIDGGLAPYVRVPFADRGLTVIPANVDYESALFVGDVLATGFWATKISQIERGDTVLILGAGPAGICTMLCAELKHPDRIIMCEQDPARLEFLKRHYPHIFAVRPEDAKDFILGSCARGGADVVVEAAGTEKSFRMAWEFARPNANVTIVALYEKAQSLPLPEMYGKNLTFRTGGVDGCDCAEILRLISEGKIDTRPLITHRFSFRDLDRAYELFEKREDGVMKIAVSME